MKRRFIKNTLLILTAITGLAISLGCLMPPAGREGRGERERGRDRFEERSEHDRGRDRSNQDADRGPSRGDFHSHEEGPEPPDDRP